MGDLNPAFSSDGRRLAFSRLTAYQASDLYLLSLSADLRPAGEPKRITFDNRWTDQPDWSADGQSVIFVSNRGGTRTLWQMRSDANRSPELLAFAGDPILTPVAARRGNRLGYVRFLQDMNIWQVNLPEPFHGAETPVRVVSSTLLDASPQISPDGRKLVFQSSRSGALEIWVAESDGSRPVQMTSFGRHSGTPQWSPDGAQIAFDSNVSGVFQIYAMSAEGGTPRILTTGQFENAVPSWSRDGQWIYFSSLRTGAPEIWKMRPNGGDVQQVTRHGGRSVFESPDGPWLYYKKSDSPGPIWRLPVQGGAETMVLPVEVYFRNFAVTAPGIYFMTTAGAINFYRFHTGTSTSVATLRARPAPGLTVSPDEKRIFYSQVDQETSNIMLVDNFR